MTRHGPARPGIRIRPRGAPPRQKHHEEEKWERVSNRSAALLRLFFAVLLLLTAAVMVMIIHLRMPASGTEAVYSASSGGARICHSSQLISLASDEPATARLVDGGVGDDGAAAAVEEDAGEAGCEELVAGVVVQC